jgi:molybdate-binding protein/DNA-binding transcriptional regulator YhcF (GntR family)
MLQLANHPQSFEAMPCMPETYLYHQIAESIRKQILYGEIKPGERLPSLRAMTERWHCTLGTVQRAYQELARQGLVASRAGQGTHVLDRQLVQAETPLHRAALVHRAESFLLEVLAAGYSTGEVEDAVRQALDRWRAVEQAPAAPQAETLRFAGSHDLAIAWLGMHFNEIAPGYRLEITYRGSLGGLIALTEGKADLAGCHLWDVESQTYNEAFVRRLLPGKRLALVTLAHRRLGLILPAGNPQAVRTLLDLARSGLRFVIRPPGAGTRVWLDTSLRRAGLSPEEIEGYTDEKLTHSQVARAVAEGQAEVGLGLEAAAQAFGLDFIPLTRERYDLAILASSFERGAIQALLAWLQQGSARLALADLAGYDSSETGKVRWIE